MLKTDSKNPDIAWSQGQFPTGWGAEMRGDKKLVQPFSREFLNDLSSCIKSAKARDLTTETITREDFSTPAIDATMQGLLRELRRGSGLIISRGIDATAYTPEDMEIIYMGLGLHLGNAVSQSSFGDILGHVAVRDKNSSRGYTSDRQLDLHTDSAEIICLMCVRKSLSGGESVFASSLKIRDVIARERPDLLQVLEAGYPYHRRGEEHPESEPITPYKIPVFSEKNGVISCRYVREIIEVAYRDLGRDLAGLEQEALDYFDEVANRPEIAFDFQLEPGDIAWMNNYQILHARRSFVNPDDLAHGRLLYRLWLQDFPSRPMAKEMLVYQNPQGRQGIDPQKNRPAGLAKYSTKNH
ncbi:TauD/TfdA family dioxygenase [Bordetella tumulicola]|uniref:TauD/TfdA family dioxygenase n=1 Tax=Bordetella tumulicola TaxID=1649133 RepID=UPI0039EF75EC